MSVFLFVVVVIVVIVVVVVVLCFYDPLVFSVFLFSSQIFPRITTLKRSVHPLQDSIPVYRNQFMLTETFNSVCVCVWWGGVRGGGGGGGALIN